MRFTHAYAANPLCSPTRASILTGLYPGRLRLTAPNGHLAEEILDPIVPASAASTAKLRHPQSATRLKNEYLTYAEVCRTNGYATAFMGKWHLGRDPYLPENQGFDVVVGGRQHPGPPGSTYFAPFSADANLPAVPAGTHVNDVLADAACNFIETNQHRPFLLNLWFYDVHNPYQCKTNLRAGYVGQSSADGRQRNPTMGAMVETMDSGLGRVLDKLEALGLATNTIVIFFSDNGGVVHEFADGAPITHNWPLRAGKASIYEGGFRVPCIVSWPGRVAPGTTNEHLLSSVDWFPTLMDMLGLTPPPGTLLDGVSHWPGITNGTPARRTVFTHFPHTITGTGSFAACAVRSNDWKLIRFFHDGPAFAHRYELYDLAADPHEQTNLAAAQPALVADLDTLITNHLADTAALLPLPNPSYIPPADPWLPNEQVLLSTASSGRLLLAANGFEPWLTSRGDLAASGAPDNLRLRLQSRCRGNGRLEWRLPGQTNFPPAQRAEFVLTHDNTLRTCVVNFTPGGPVAQLRLRLSTDPGQTELALIELRQGTNVLAEWMWPEPDSDGDGTSDAREAQLGRDPLDPADLGFEFDEDDNFEQWVIGANVGSASVEQSAWNGTSLTGDPYINHLAFNFPGNTIPRVAVRLRSSAAGAVQFYWGNTLSNSFHASRLLQTNYTAAGMWQTVVFNPASHPQWAGKTITRLRVDPGSVSNSVWAVDWIRDSDGSPNDRLRLRGERAGDEMLLRFYGNAGMNYHLQARTHLDAGAWNVAASLAPLVTGEQAFRRPMDTPEQFFRLFIEP
jgi:arylsulfatase A-like enzyme